VEQIDVCHLPAATLKANVNPKLHQIDYFTGGPLVPTFAKVPAATGSECWHRTTSVPWPFSYATIRLAGSLSGRFVAEGDG
jgi:hypothetical protein